MKKKQKRNWYQKQLREQVVWKRNPVGLQVKFSSPRKTDHQKERKYLETNPISLYFDSTILLEK